MCIIFIKTNPNPNPGDFRLIIASNRDEFYERPAKEAFLCDKTNIIGGRDLQNGKEESMWLGLKVMKEVKKLRFSALLNVSGENSDSTLSRGVIVPGYLNSNKSSTEYFENLTQNGLFPPFNLVNVEMSENDICTYFMSKFPDQICKFKGENVMGFSNSPVNRPFNKVSIGRFEFERIIKTCTDNEMLKSELIKFLKSEKKYLPDFELQLRRPNIFEDLGSVFVKCGGQYGTRTHTIILVDYEWNVEFFEETMKTPIDPKNILWKQNSIKSNL